MANSLLDVVDTFLSLDRQYLLLRVACQTQTDRDDLDEEYAAAQENNEACTAKILEDDDAVVAALDAELKTRNLELKLATTQMGDMAKVLSNLSAAVKIGSQLLDMVP